MKIALATYSDLPLLNDDDKTLIPALLRLGVVAEPVDWEKGLVLSEFDAVIIRSCWNYFEKRKEFLRWVKAVEASGIPVLNSSEIIEWNSDKIYLRELAAAGIPCVDTVWVEEPSQIAERISLALTGSSPEFIVKPSISNNAWKTFRLSRAELSDFVPQIREMLLDSAVMIQPFIDEIVESGEISFIFFDGSFSHAVLKRPAQGDFRVQHTHGGNYLPISVPSSWIATARKAAHYKSDALFCRVDVIPTSSGLLLGELEMIEPYLHLSAIEEGSAFPVLK